MADQCAAARLIIGCPRRLRAGTERGYEPFLLYDTATGITPPVNCYWSNYYKVHEREPSNLQPAPWVGRGR